MKLPVARRRAPWFSHAMGIGALSGLLLLLSSFLGFAATLPAAPAITDGTAGAKNAGLVEALSGPELQQAIESLKEHYFRPSDLSPEELQRALLTGMLTRISPGASLIQSEGEPVVGEEQPFRKEILKDSIVYFRLGALNWKNLEAMDGALKEGVLKGGSVKEGTRPVILDLRATGRSNDFQLAGEVLGRFCPAGKAFFTLKGPGATGVREIGGSASCSKQESRGLLVVVIDGENAGASEVIAAILRANGKAILIGEPTKGEGLVFSDFKVGTKAILRVAVSEVILGDGSRIDSSGVAPDVKVEMSGELKAKVLALELEQGVKELVFETERPRMNEASLVAGTNPEMDAYQNAQNTQKKGKPAPSEAPQRDVALQRAVDLITTIGVYQRQ